MRSIESLNNIFKSRYSNNISSSTESFSEIFLEYSMLRNDISRLNKSISMHINPNKKYNTYESLDFFFNLDYRSTESFDFNKVKEWIRSLVQKVVNFFKNLWKIALKCFDYFLGLGKKFLALFRSYDKKLLEKLETKEVVIEGKLKTSYYNAIPSKMFSSIILLHTNDIINKMHESFKPHLIDEKFMNGEKTEPMLNVVSEDSKNEAVAATNELINKDIFENPNDRTAITYNALDFLGIRDIKDSKDLDKRIDLDSKNIKTIKQCFINFDKIIQDNANNIIKSLKKLDEYKHNKEQAQYIAGILQFNANQMHEASRRLNNTVIEKLMYFHNIVVRLFKNK